MQRTYKLLLIVVAVLISSCGGMRARDNVQNGILIEGTPQQAFLDVWGPPDRTRLEHISTEEKRLEFSRWGGSYGRKDLTYEIWEYQRREVTLAFETRSKALAAWNTKKSTAELRTIR
jgi:hypothetical protein